MNQFTIAASIFVALVLTLPICHAAQLQQLSYDANGNLVSGDGFYREYDGYNRLVRTREGNAAGGTILEEQDWDLIEERVLARRTYTSGTLNKTVYYWTKDFVQVINASDGAITNETYVYFNDRLVAQRVNNDTTFIHSDHLGSSIAITSTTGQVIERTIYEPYGKPITGATQSRLDYTGKEQLPTAGDYDYNFRRYNPNWGMFTQPDNLLPNVYDPQQLNRYSYARNNPISLRDDGHQPENPFVSPNLPDAVYSIWKGAPIVARYIWLGAKASANGRFSDAAHYVGRGIDEAGHTATVALNALSPGIGVLTIDEQGVVSANLEETISLPNHAENRRVLDEEFAQREINLKSEEEQFHRSVVAPGGTTQDGAHPRSSQTTVPQPTSSRRNPFNTKTPSGWKYNTINGIPVVDRSVPKGTPVGGGWVKG